MRMKKLEKYQPEVEEGERLFLAPVDGLPSFTEPGRVRKIENDDEIAETTLEVDFNRYGVFFLRADCFLAPEW